MKKFFTLFLTLMTSVMLWAYDFQSGDLYYNITSNVAPYTVEVTSGNTKYSGDITIPSSVTYNGITYAVTGIRSRAFQDCSSLTSVTIPNSVTSIGYAAFEDTGIFNDNSNWENGVLYISNCLVDAKESLSGACTIKIGTRIIADYAFYNCSSLTSVTIPNNVTSIGGWAFCKCSSLTSVTIPNSVTSIGSSAFQDCSSLTSVTIPEGVTSIGFSAFQNCSSLTSVTIPNSVTSIGQYAFSKCSSLTSVTIPNSVTSIGSYAFIYCSSLTSITIPSSVTSIGVWTFGYCSSLTSITIPSSVTSIEGFAFDGCSSLTAIIVEGDNTAYDSRENCNAIIETATNTLIAGCQSTTIPNSVTSIGAYAFQDCSSLTSVTIPNSVTSIGSAAFRGCSSLTSVTIPNSMTSIGGSAFEDCSSLTSVTIPNSVTSIGYQAFYGCSSLTSVTIPEGVTSIGFSAFQNCSSLTSVTIPNSVTSIGSNAFYNTGIFNDNSNWENGVLYISNCLVAAKESLLGTYTIKDGTRIIGDRAFYNCSSLTSVTIPNGVTSIGGFAFLGCSSLTSVTIPNSVTSIGKRAFEDTGIFNDNSNWENGVLYISNCLVDVKTSLLGTYTIKDGTRIIANEAFRGCSSLTSITIPSSVTSIGDEAFGYCSSLTSVTIPNSVTSIGSNAFYNCSSLTSVTIPSSVTSIGSGAFYNCSSLTSITIPSSVTSIEYCAFYNCSSLNTIYVGATNPPALGANAFTNTSVSTCYIPCGTKAAYEASAWASQVSEFVEEGCEEYTITYTSTDGNIVIPNKADAFGANIVSNTYENGVGTITFDGPVTSIGSSAFYNCSSLTSVTIPSSVTSIGSSAFFRCSTLTSVTIPKSVETIGQDAFRECGALTNVTISNGVMKIGEEAFRGCSALTSVVIPSSVTSMGRNPFDACPGIISIVVDENNPKYDSRNNCNGIIETATNRLITGCQNTIIPYGVTNIDHAFWGCSSLKEITIPNTITNIGTYTFESCSLTSIVIPKSVTSIGDRAFSLCPLSSIVVEEGNPKYDSRNNCNAIIITSTNTLLAGSDNTIIPEGITAISPNAFRGRKHIASIAIPNSVTRIGEYAFATCTSLTSITIPDGVTAIKQFAFSFCDALTSVIIGKGVNSVDQGAFFNSPVETVYFNAQEPAVMDRADYEQFSSSPTCYIPCGTKAAYEASDWANYMESFIETYEYTLTLSSSDNSMGSATITQEPACGTPAIIVATPNDGYFFSQWSDGNTDNPRTLTVNEDIELAAEFEEIGDYGFYSRTVRIGYNTICLPHGAIHFTGATFYEIAHILKNKKKIFFDEVKTLEAGKPYIFYPHSNEVTIYYDNTTSAVPLSHNGLHGTFDGITAASNLLKGKYLVAGNRMVLCGDGCSLAANRAYIVLDEISDKDHPAIPGIKRVSMDYSEENATTALDNITDESIVAPIQEGVYDILGRKVDAPTVSGFYIINGKKVFIAL